MIHAKGIAHAVLTVSDIQKTKQFYEDLLEVQLKMDDTRSFSLLAVNIPCWFTQWKATEPDDRFDERRVGLDHIAFEVATLRDLEMIEGRLTTMGVKHAGIERFAGKYPYVAFRDPDNIQTEFFINEEL